MQEKKCKKVLTSTKFEQFSVLGDTKISKNIYQIIDLMYNRPFTPDMIRELKSNEIFVFKVTLQYQKSSMISKEVAIVCGSFFLMYLCTGFLFHCCTFAPPY